VRFPACLLLLAALPASAGVLYDFETSVQTPRTSENVTGRVYVDGQRYRAELMRGGRQHVVISDDGDASATFLDLEKRTWSNRARVGEMRTSSLFLWPLPGAKVNEKPRVSYRKEDAHEIAGWKTVQHVIDVLFRVDCRMDGAKAGGLIRMHVRMWATEELPPLPLQRPLRTGYPQVDRELDKIAENIRGMIVRNAVEITRTLDGGPPQIEKTLTTVTRLEETEIAASQFAVPESFTYAGPATTRRE
jgi:hypothetical protein